ncbi:hypothetical protein AB0I00_32955 [Streptomyces sp. NPDC050803]|uniref:hypothetical protein n=1 Tax=unclassified Streptomyces TaxID=2593676 RepID=UPI0034373FF4
MGQIDQNENVSERAGRFLWTSGRVLEQRRFAWHFLGEGGPEGATAALEAYRAEEGGYAYGLEPDVRGPAPQPATLRTGVPILAETGALAGPIGHDLCDWLTKVTAADGGVPAALPSLRPYPRPPWVQIPEEPAGGLLPTGWITGPMLGAGLEHPWVQGASAFCRTAVQNLGDETHPYEVHAAIAYLDGTPDRAWAKTQAARLGELVRRQRLVLLDPDRPETARIAPGYAPGEYHFPHDYATRPESLARDWFTDDEMRTSLRALAAAQEADGGWPIRWAEWSPTIRVEARPMVTVDALLTLRAYGTPTSWHPGLF